MSLASRIVWRVVLLPFVLGPLVFYGAGWFMIRTQDYRIQHFLPVAAVVRSAKVITHYSSSRDSSTTYAPEIKYAYRVDGRSYIAARILPVGDVSRSDDWAARIVRQFPPGHSCRAWYNPLKPSDAYLIRAYSFLPVAMVLFSVPFVLIFTGGMGYAICVFGFVPRPIPTSDGRFEIRPASTATGRWRVSFLAGLFWYGTFALAVGDYCFRSRSLPGTLGSIGAGVYLLLGLLFVVASVKSFNRSRLMRAPVVKIDAPEPRLGDAAEVTVQIEFRTDLRRTVSIGLACDLTTKGKKTTRSTTYERYVDAARLAGHLATMCQDRVRLELPVDGRPTSSPRDRTGAYTWRISVVARFDDGTENRTDYPLVLLAPASAPVAAST